MTSNPPEFVAPEVAPNVGVLSRAMSYVVGFCGRYVTWARERSAELEAGPLSGIDELRASMDRHEKADDARFEGLEKSVSGVRRVLAGLEDYTGDPLVVTLDRIVQAEARREEAEKRRTTEIRALVAGILLLLVERGISLATSKSPTETKESSSVESNRR